MAILKFDKSLDFVNRFTLHPSRSYTSSSSGIMGTIKLTSVKEGRRLSLRADSITNYNTIRANSASRLSSSIYGASPRTDFEGEFYDANNDAVGLFGAINTMVNEGSAIYGPDKKYFDITRFTPYLETLTLSSTTKPNTYTLSISSTGSFRKNTIRKQIFRDNAGIFRKCDWAYSNAHTINFFTASSVEANCAIIYPDPTGSDGTAKYRPDAGFTFEFYINPRYTTDNDTSSFNAGTIIHYSSAYAISLATGSSKDINGLPNGYRLLLQLSSSADVNPSSIAFNAAPSTGREMIYSSSDNALTKNTWHHVAIRWGGISAQNGTGSFVIDGNIDTEFVIPSASITAPPGLTTYVGITGREDANALFLGNYFDGTNTLTNAIAGFFNSKVNTREGLIEIQGAGGSLIDDPTSYGFTNKLNAELHELRIYKKYRDLKQINNFKNVGFGESQFSIEKSGSLALYVPPFFVMESPIHKRFLRAFNLSSSPKPASTPYNVTMSFNTEGYILNHSNFFRDFVTHRYPRFFNLTGSTSLTIDDRHVNDQLRDDTSMVARNFLIMPNDNGGFSPDYTLLKTGTFTNTPDSTSILRRFVNDRSRTDLSIITLNRMLDGRKPKKQPSSDVGDSLYEPTYPSTDPTDGAFYNDRQFEYVSIEDDWNDTLNSPMIIGKQFESNIMFKPNGLDRMQSPHTPSSTARGFYVFEATGDESSNQAVFFNVSNIFYGKRIKPGTLTISDTGLIGSDNKINMTLKDDGFGNLYRSNAPTPNRLHSVGNVFYNEGIIAIKSPHLFQFGSGSFNIDFNGIQDVINREMLIEAPKNLLNVSSNPTYLKLAPTDNANETADEFVYITTILLHDKDMNVIGRTTLSEPIVKRITDAITFRLKKDF